MRNTDERAADTLSSEAPSTLTETMGTMTAVDAASSVGAPALASAPTAAASLAGDGGDGRVRGRDVGAAGAGGGAVKRCEAARSSMSGATAAIPVSGTRRRSLLAGATVMRCRATAAAPRSSVASTSTTNSRGGRGWRTGAVASGRSESHARSAVPPGGRATGPTLRRCGASRGGLSRASRKTSDCSRSSPRAVPRVRRSAGTSSNVTGSRQALGRRARPCSGARPLGGGLAGGCVRPGARGPTWYGGGRHAVRQGCGPRASRGQPLAARGAK